MNDHTITRYAVDELRVEVFADPYEVGRRAAVEIADELRRRLAGQPGVRIVFASAPSQHHLQAALARAEGIDWSRVTALHMDEYVGLPPDSTDTFGHDLTSRLFDAVCPGRVELIDSTAAPETEARRYAEILAEAPVDICCLGIGENGHLAFNEPGCDLDNPRSVEIVDLQDRSRTQQVNEGRFARLGDVPRQALTVTIPVLLAADRLFCVVTGPAKAEAVRRTLTGPISADCPASTLRRRPYAKLYLDQDAAG